ncbi:MAG: aminotransferase class V-fold PLP-dependent enzyme [bacterium]
MKNENGTSARLRLEDMRSEIIGINTLVPLLDGREQPYVFLDNAASTPAFKRVMKRIADFMPWYSGVHRGTGFKSQIATRLYDSAHDVCGQFVGADLATNLVVFLKNTTECVNKLAHRFNFSGDDVVICTSIEHHSNDLPWRRVAKVVHVGSIQDGHLDLKAMKETLQKYKGRVKLVAVNGASNITGICSPVHDIAEMAHAAGAKIFVDAAQMVAHYPVNMMPDDDPRHIDFLAYSAHKMYAPFGTGVLIGPMEFFGSGEPDSVGGGVASIVTLDHVEWNPAPHRDEAGSPNVVGGIALAQAATMLKSVGLENIAAHETHLLRYALDRLKKISGIHFYGPTGDLSNKVGVIAFNMDGMHPGLVGAILGAEAGIGVRSGYFCAQPYVKNLLNVGTENAKDSGCGIVETEFTTFPGMVRASFGCYSNEADVDALVEMVEKISRKEYRGEYVQDPDSGAFSAKGFVIDHDKYVSPFESDLVSSGQTFSESAWG